MRTSSILVTWPAQSSCTWSKMDSMLDRLALLRTSSFGTWSCQLMPRKGKSDRGAPRKRYKDQLKRQLAQAGIIHQSWQQETSDRDSWRFSVRKASRKFEAERHEAAKERHRRQKERAASESSSAQTAVCPKCSRALASRIGLYSHQRSRKDWPPTSPTICVCQESAIRIFTYQQDVKIKLLTN